MTYKSDIEKANRIAEAIEFPDVILIDNCSACNLRCSMCDHSNIGNFRKIETMKWDLYAKIVDEIAVENPKARIWEIFFGDPFLCRDMDERIRYAKNKGIREVVLNTNGVLMDEKKAAKYIGAGLDAMYVGIDAATKETYDKIRVGGDFEKAVKNVIHYKKLLDDGGKPEQKIIVQFVKSDINEHETEQFKALWQSHKIPVKIRPKISWAGLTEASNLCENRENSRKPCYWLMQTMNICADGRVALCSVDIHCRVPCGDVSKKSLKEVWKNQLRIFRRMHIEKDFSNLPEMCRVCRDWQSAYADYY